MVAVTYHFIFQAVILGIYPAGQYQYSRRHLHRRSVCINPVILPSGKHGVFIRHIPTVFPQFPEQRVIYRFQPLRIILSPQKCQADRLPGLPRGRKSIQPEGADPFPISFRVIGNPFCRLVAHHRFRYQTAAMRARPFHRSCNLINLFPTDLLLGIVINNSVKDDFPILPTFRALVAPAFLSSFVITVLNVRSSFDGRC